MKRLVLLIFILNGLTITYGQNTDVRSMVDSLQYLKSTSLDCNTDLYWRIIAQGSKAIPFLINKLSDTIQTNISHNCKLTRLTVSDIACLALQQIAFFPVFIITHIQFDAFYGNGCWSFFDYFFDNANKKNYQDLVAPWYEKNKTKFKRQKISKKKQTLCQKQFHIDTYLIWTD